METVVTDMHQRVNLLDAGMADSVNRLDETTTTLMARVAANEQQVRELASMMEENQRKVDNLLKMLDELRRVLYRHWGLPYTPIVIPKSTTGGSAASRPAPVAGVTESAQAPAVESQPAGAEAAPPLSGGGDNSAGDDGAAYASAKEKYDQEDYTGAQGAFSSFLADYPRSTHRDKAQFWVGKSLLNQSEYSRAITAFEELRSGYPDSTYMAFAIHNQAVAHYRLGDRDRALALMEEVVAKYPTSTAAEHARRDLEQLRGAN